LLGKGKIGENKTSPSSFSKFEEGRGKVIWRPLGDDNLNTLKEESVKEGEHLRKDKTTL